MNIKNKYELKVNSIALAVICSTIIITGASIIAIPHYIQEARIAQYKRDIGFNCTHYREYAWGNEARRDKYGCTDVSEY